MLLPCTHYMLMHGTWFFALFPMFRGVLPAVFPYTSPPHPNISLGSLPVWQCLVYALCVDPIRARVQHAYTQSVHSHTSHSRLSNCGVWYPW